MLFLRLKQTRFSSWKVSDFKKVSVVAKADSSPFESHLEHQERRLEEKRAVVKTYLLQDSRFQLLQSIIPVEFLKIKLEEEVAS